MVFEPNPASYHDLAAQSPDHWRIAALKPTSARIFVFLTIYDEPIVEFCGILYFLFLPPKLWRRDGVYVDGVEGVAIPAE